MALPMRPSREPLSMLTCAHASHCSQCLCEWNAAVLCLFAAPSSWQAVIAGAWSTVGPNRIGSHLCSSPLEDAKCFDDCIRHALPGPPNFEVLQGALCLSSPVPARQHAECCTSTKTLPVRTGCARAVAASNLSAGTSRGPNVSFSVLVSPVVRPRSKPVAQFDQHGAALLMPS